MVNLDVATPQAYSVQAAQVNPATVNPGGAVVILVPTPGAPGPRGASGSGAEVFGETPAGTQNGSNLVFTTTHNFQTATTAVYRNGLREHLGVGYTETASNTLTFTTAPQSSDTVTVDYLVQ